jgi:hypothetical protein
LLLVGSATMDVDGLPVRRLTDMCTSHSRKTTPLWLAPQHLGFFKELALVSLQDPQENRKVALHNWSSSDTIPFVTGWEHQKTLVNVHLERLSALAEMETEQSQFITSEIETHNQGVDRILFLQHDPV